MTITWRATTEDLYGTRRKAELVGGRLHVMEPTGLKPALGAVRVYMSLLAHQRAVGGGIAVPDNVGFLVELPERLSFSPDAAFFTGQPSGTKFVTGAPTFAVEVCSENDYGPTAEREMLDKRRDYFAAGTLVVWDVDLINPDTVRVFKDGDAEVPAVIYRRGETAEAEPAVPGWRFPVDELFD
ncbi:MAG TPA: Uma2 family endonuclease [Chloroflexota bacterium]|nr:Uma2 family endonuclease [Chloroflexota bacterium]